MTNQNIKKHGYKTLCACAIATMLTFNIPVQAQDNEVPLPKSEDKAYTLTKVDAPGENTITKYEWSNTENKYVPVYYRVDLSKTEYGNPNGDTTLTYGWEKNTNGNLEFKQNPANPVGQIITYKYNASDALTRISNNEDKSSETISGVFVGQTTGSTSGTQYGGAIYNSGSNAKLGDINADFVNNYTQTDSQYIETRGGAIYNEESTIQNIVGDFIGNYAKTTRHAAARGGAIYNAYQSVIGNITGDFIGNYVLGISSADGGAISNTGTIGNITGNFCGNYSINYYEAMGGAIANYNNIAHITGDFIGNYAKGSDIAMGGAIANLGFIGTIDYDTNSITYGEIKNSSFFNNYAESQNSKALGGAIFSSNKIDITADNGKSVFSGNKTISNGVTEQNAIAMYGLAQIDSSTGEIVFFDILTGQSSTNTANLTLKAQNNGVILFDDTIRGGAVEGNSMEPIEIPETAFELKITGDNTGKVILNNDVINANISLDNTNLYLGRDNVFDQSQSLTLNSGSMSMINNQAGTMNIQTFNLNGTTNLGVDVDLANKQMDTIKATNYNVAEGAKLNVNSINLLNDAKEDLTNIQFTDNKDVASATAYTGASPIAYSPIYKYEVAYNPDEGFFTFSRGGSTSDGGGSSNPSDAFNPAVLVPSVVTQTGGYATQLQTFNNAFQHSDTFMNIPYLERISMINKNRYAMSPTGEATDVGTFSPLLTKEETSGFWVKPYASFESIPLNNGPKVSNINYGTLVGYDSSLTPIAKGWERVLTGYIGYNGASQRYSGVDAYQNGGILGGTATMYKGNFFNATTLSVGATAGDATTMYGSENYAMLLAGVGNKTGYNFEFKDGRIILQPNFLISYTFVNTFDYTNGAGVRIKSDPLNAIQLAPGLKLIGNTKNGWQPYLSVAMVWNLLDDSKVTANDVRLPEMSIDPYVQYGAGIQKRFKDRFIAFGQAMIHNGGRNGIALTAGLRWTVGK